MTEQYVDKISLPGNRFIKFRDTLAEMKDFQLSNLQGNQTLVYDDNLTKWKNSSLKTINGNSIIGSGNFYVYRDFSDVITLSDNSQMSTIFNNETYNNSSIILKISDNRTITMDSWAINENYFAVLNSASIPKIITFDYSGQGIIEFIGRGEYVIGDPTALSNSILSIQSQGYSTDDSTLSVVVPALSNSIITMKVLNNNAVVFSISRTRSHISPVTDAELDSEDVALVVNTSNGLKFIPVDDVETYDIDLTQYELKPYVRFHRGRNGKSVVIHKNAIGGNYWAIWNKYKLECDLTESGEFHWTVTINGVSKSGDVTWSVGDTLDSIVTQLNTGAVSSYLSFSHVSGENFIRISKGGYSYSIFTLSNNTGATLIDLSKYTKVNGVQQSEAHRDWQTENVHSMFPSLGFLVPNTVQYAKNGYNLSWMCGGNLARYKIYYNANGSSTYVAESSIAARMTQAGFNNLNNDGVAEHQALYDKYNGSWESYMDGSMIQINDNHTNGIEYQSYDNGDTQTAILDSITTMDFDGTYINAYPIAHTTHQVTDDILGAFNMGTEHELAVIMEDNKMAKINKAFSYLNNSNYITNTDYYWSVARCYSNSAWLYYGYTGRLNNHYLYNALSSRAFAYLT